MLIFLIPNLTTLCGLFLGASQTEQSSYDIVHISDTDSGRQFQNVKTAIKLLTELPGRKHTVMQANKGIKYCRDKALVARCRLWVEWSRGGWV